MEEYTFVVAILKNGETLAVAKPIKGDYTVKRSTKTKTMTMTIKGIELGYRDVDYGKLSNLFGAFAWQMYQC